MVTLSFLFNYAVLGNADRPAGYHWVNLGLHAANVMQFIYALQKAGKQFQFMLYPKSRHGVADPLLVKHMRQMMTDFILENL